MTAASPKVFDRYAGSPSDGDNGVRMPRDSLDAKTSAMTLSEVVGRMERFDEETRAMYPWADRFVMGFPLASWQRPAVWTATQKSRLIESIWSGIDIGSYMINELWQMQETENGNVFREFSEVLLDGQQRLSAIEDYLLDKFAVKDAHGVLRLWSELPRVERRRFMNTHFARSSVKSWDEKELRLAYVLRAFGGTPHTESERPSLD